MIDVNLLEAKGNFSGDVENLRDEILYVIDIYRDEINKNKKDNEKLSFEDVFKDFADDLVPCGRSQYKRFFNTKSNVTRFEDKEVQERIKNGIYNR